MCDWHQILALCSTENPMDYCEEFGQIKSILEDSNENTKKFQKLCFRSGNEGIINDLGQKIMAVLEQRGLFDSDANKPVEHSKPMLRKIVMFLLVNTDATYKHNLKDDVLVGHVAEICPLMPKFLTMALIWELQLSEILFEAIGSGLPYWFVLQHMDAATEALTYIPDPIKTINDLTSLLTSLLKNMLRSLNSEMPKVDRKIVYTKYYDHCILLLRQFHTPDAQKFKSLPKKRRHRYAGLALKHLLEMVVAACDYYDNPQAAADALASLPIYEIGKSSVETAEVKHQSNGKNSEVVPLMKEQIRLIIVALMNTLQNHVLNVSIDVYMYWTEIDVSPGRTLQEAIGEKCFYLCERIQSDKSLAHNVEKQLQQFARRPKSLIEIIREARIGDILNSLEDKTLPFETRKAWFDELLKRNEVFGNDECLETMQANIKLMSLENMQAILDHIKLVVSRRETQYDASANTTAETTLPSDKSDATANCSRPAQDRESSDEENDSMEAEEDTSNCNELIELLLKALKNLKTEDMIRILHYQTQLFGLYNTTFDITADFSQRATQFLNKFGSSSANIFDIQDFLCLCFESSNEMWLKFFETALISTDAISNFCGVVKQTRSYSWPYFNNLFTNSLSDPRKLSEKLYPNMLCEIYFTLFFPDSKTEFITKYVNKHMTAARESEDFSCLLPMIRGLILISEHGETQACKPLNFAELSAPMLVSVALVMDKARWNLYCFTHQREELVRLCVQFIQTTSKKFLPAATEKDRDWISSKIKQSVDPLTQYYFQKFAMKPTESQMEFDQFLRLEDQNPLNEKSEIIKFLTINLVYCTTKETEWLIRSDKLRPHIHSSMCLLAQSIEVDNINAITNYRFCLGNYANILRKVLIPQNANDIERLESLLRNILKVLNTTPAPIYDETFMDFEPLLTDLLNRFTVSSLPKECFESLGKFIKKMPAGKGRDIFLNKFNTFVSENIP